MSCGCGVEFEHNPFGNDSCRRCGLELTNEEVYDANRSRNRKPDTENLLEKSQKQNQIYREALDKCNVLNPDQWNGIYFKNIAKEALEKASEVK